MTTEQKKFCVVVGTRPNFIKAAPLLKRMSGQLGCIVVHTGQHFDDKMSKVFFEELKIPKPNFDLHIEGSYVAARLGRIRNELVNIIKNNGVTDVVVVGDVDSTLGASLATKEARVRLHHVEAGLRSFDREMPEEINRIIVDHLADHLYTTEETANNNLETENFSKEQIHFVGNLMIESLLLYEEEINRSSCLEELGVKQKTYIVATIHRAEHLRSKNILENILLLLNKVSADVEVLFPIHPNTEKHINQYGLTEKIENIRKIEPLGYLDFINLVKNSSGVITDSGGIQEETSHLGVPCCTLRNSTERPVTTKQGTNKLFVPNVSSYNEVREHLLQKNVSSSEIPLWDSEVSARIIEVFKKV